MTTQPPLSNATNPLSHGGRVGGACPLYRDPGEGLGVRGKAVEMMKLTKRQIKVTMFAAGAGKLGSLKNEKLVEKQ